MHTFIWVFFAIGFALMLFSSIQDDIPDELSFLKGTPSFGVPAALPPGAQQFTHLGWRVTESPGTAEIVRSFNGPITVNGQSFEAPELGLLCYQGVLSVRIDTRLPTTGIRNSPVGFANTNQMWDKGATGTNLLAVDPRATLRGLLSGAKGAAALTLSYRDLGAQSAEIDLTGIGELAARMGPGCQP
jgi:hypothetical protein